MGGVRKSRTSGSMKKTSGVSIEGSSEKFISVKNGVKIKVVTVHKNISTSTGNGSMFDVLCDEDTNMVNEVDQLDVTKDNGSSNHKGKMVLIEITNCTSNQSKASTNFPSQGNKKNRKKEGVVATIGRGPGGDL
ncbi:hypothetical protein QYF36_011566 [Acer negundo]|nr:hypothetical protein QYF36_011566 [Acer negundo]